MNEKTAGPAPPRVFISYSHDDRTHCDRVLSLAQQLRADGLDVELDQFHQHELVHWPRWCEEQMRPERSDYVLCVCTAEYKRRVEGRVPADVGRGVFWEANLIYNYLYDEKGNRRCVPIWLSGAAEDDIPTVLRGYTRFQIDTFGLGDGHGSYAVLYRLLTGQAGVQKGEVGELRRLPSLPGLKRETDFMHAIEEINQKVGKIEQRTQETHVVAVEILDILRDKPVPASTPERPHNLPPWMAPEIFIGREEELGELRDGLCARESQPLAIVQPQVVKGGGGIGKTRLAIQAAWVVYVEGKCEMAFYLSASSPRELDTQLAALAETSLLALYEGRQPPTELDARRDDVVRALRARMGRWILVLDAADSPEARDAVKALVKKLAGGRIVITSRRDDWPVGTVHKIPLDVFTSEEARACLCSRYWKPEPSAEELASFDCVAEELDRLPLALALAAAYMDARRLTPQRYLEDWREKRDALLAFAASDLEESRSLLAAFKLSYDQLGDAARALLHLFSWLAAEPVPRRLIEDSESVRALLAGAAEESKSVDVTDVLAQLRTLSLIQLDEDSLQLHKVILACARAVRAESERTETIESALQWASESLPGVDFDTAGWEMWNRLGPHLDALLDKVENIEAAEADVDFICSQYGLLLYQQARYAVAEPLMKRALAIDEKSFGQDHPNVARDLNNLATLLQATNRLEEAEPLMKRALAIDEKSFGPDHPNVAIRLNNLAQLLQATNRLAEAEPLMKRALAIDEKSFGPDHPNVAIRLNNLAQLLQATNRLEEAEPLMKRALAIDEKSFGPDHPKVAIRLNNLAGLLQATNRLAEAEPLMKRALAIDEKSFGPDHPNVARHLNSLAQLLQDTNRLAEAEPLMKRALAIDEKSFGPDHPNVATHLNNLAQLLKDTNRLAEAEPLMKRALAIDEKSFGQDHPEVATDLNNLATLLQDTNRLAEAEPLMKRALEILFIFTRSTGHERPGLRTIFGNYLHTLDAMSLTPEQIARRIEEIGKQAGFEAESYRSMLSRLFE